MRVPTLGILQELKWPVKFWLTLFCVLQFKHFKQQNHFPEMLRKHSAVSGGYKLYSHLYNKWASIIMCMVPCSAAHLCCSSSLEWAFLGVVELGMCVKWWLKALTGRWRWIRFALFFSPSQKGCVLLFYLFNSEEGKLDWLPAMHSSGRRYFLKLIQQKYFCILRQQKRSLWAFFLLYKKTWASAHVRRLSISLEITFQWDRQESVNYPLQMLTGW